MCAPVISQYLVIEILRRGLFDNIRDKAIEAYKHKGPLQACFVLLWLHENIDCFKFVDLLLEKYDVAVIPAAPFFIGDEDKGVIRLNFSLAPVNFIDEGVRRIAKLHRELSVK